MPVLSCSQHVRRRVHGRRARLSVGEASSQGVVRAARSELLCRRRPRRRLRAHPCSWCFAFEVLNSPGTVNASLSSVLSQTEDLLLHCQHRQLSHFVNGVGRLDVPRDCLQIRQCSLHVQSALLVWRSTFLVLDLATVCRVTVRALCLLCQVIFKRLFRASEPRELCLTLTSSCTSSLFKAVNSHRV